MWIDGDIAATRCPVRELTPDVRGWLQLASASYELRVDGWSGTPALVRVALPGDGGVGGQDARTMQALEVIAATSRQLLHEQVRRARQTRREEARRQDD